MTNSPSSSPCRWVVQWYFSPAVLSLCGWHFNFVMLFWWWLIQLFLFWMYLFLWMPADRALCSLCNFVCLAFILFLSLSCLYFDGINFVLCKAQSGTSSTNRNLKHISLGSYILAHIWAISIPPEWDCLHYGSVLWLEEASTTGQHIAKASSGSASAPAYSVCEKAESQSVWQSSSCSCVCSSLAMLSKSSSESMKSSSGSKLTSQKQLQTLPSNDAICEAKKFRWRKLLSPTHYYFTVCTWYRFKRLASI